MKPITSSRLIPLVSVCLILFYNFAFFSGVTSVYPLNSGNVAFLISLAVLFGSIICILLSLVSFKYIIKPALIIILMASASAAYFMDTYNVVIDETMIDNIVKTNLSEASDLLSFRFLTYLFFLGVIPSVLVYKTRIAYRRVDKEFISRLKLIALAIGLAVASVLLFSSYYASFFREHKPLRYYANPSYYIYSTGKYLSEFFSIAPSAMMQIGLDAKIPKSDPHRELTVLVIGETARADRFSLNGYSRETNPYLKKKDVISFTNFWACGTSTAYSLPCLFSGYTQSEFDKTTAGNTENVLDVLERSGVNVIWLDNNSDSKGVALRVPYENYRTPEKNPVCDPECRDEGMLPGLQAYIDAHPTGDIFIVLHQMGNHGPAYYKRYPERFEKFTPVCKTNQLEQCSIEEINNAYDNAILYTDYFLAKVIDLLDSNQKKFEAAMIYVSDHGESLGENGLYLHGLPYMIAPDTQKRVPVIMWFSGSFDMHEEINIDALKKRKDERLSHDNIFHTLMGLMEVQSTAYDKTMDLIEHHEE